MSNAVTSNSNRIAELESALAKAEARNEALQQQLEVVQADFEKKTKEHDEVNTERENLLNKLQEVIVEYQDKENQLEKEHALLEEAYYNLEEKNRELEQKNYELAQLDELKSNFLSMISHELRTPITVVQGNTELLLDHLEQLSPKQTQVLLNTMVVRLKELIFLVETLLNLASIEAKKFAIYPTWLNLRDMISSIHDQISPLILKKKITFEKHISQDLSVAYLDESSFNLVLINILINAIKFNHEEGTVRIAMISDNGNSDGDIRKILISVKDTGIGIPSSKHKQIFEKFYQVDSSNTRQYGGSGIGLALAKEIVDLHEGEIWVESEPNQGSEFFIRLPQPEVPSDEPTD